MRLATACTLLLAAAAACIAVSPQAPTIPAPAEAAADAFPAVEHNAPELLHLAAGRPPPRKPVSLRKAPGKPSGKAIRTGPKKQTTGGVSGIKAHKAKAATTTSAASAKKPLSASEKRAAVERLTTLRGQSKSVSSSVAHRNGKQALTPQQRQAAKERLSAKLRPKQETVVVGRVPSYVFLGAANSWKIFDIRKHVWDRMTPAQRDAANIKFLDRAIANNSRIMLSRPAKQAEPGTAFYKELQYLYSKGYKLSSDGKELTR